MKSNYQRYLILPLTVGLLLAILSFTANAGVSVNFLYSLANFHGKAPLNDVRVYADLFHDEAYVIETGNVRVYNENGMEIFWFGNNPELGNVYDIAVVENGDILLLTYTVTLEGTKHFIIRCNYRGVAKEKITLAGLPPEYSGFIASDLFYRDGRILLANVNQMRAIVTDLSGVFIHGYDFAEIINVPVKKRENTEIYGISVDREGNILFTVPVLFKAFVVSPKGELVAEFGKAGSAPGMFGQVSGIAKDENGNYFVVERLRSAVMVFDKEFKFIKEFGYRGNKPGNLIFPHALASGNSGKLYVTQVLNRGVSVFSVTSD